MTVLTRITPPVPGSWTTWERVMECALEEAQQALAQGEVPVGAVVLDATGAILGKGHNETLQRNDPTAHAEIRALRNAALCSGNYRLERAYLAVTLEPCMMCTGALVHARLGGLIFGAFDVKAGAVASCIDGLELPFHNHHLWHLGGILAEQCSALLHHFFAERRCE